MYSYHIFMFPFRWEFPNATTLKERHSVKKFHDQFIKENKIWNYEQFKLTNTSDYNEYIYFYDFIRSAIYDEESNKNNETKKTMNINQNILMKHYHINKLFKQIIYNIYIDNNKINKTFSLVVDDVFLHIYNTGIGIINFRLKNEKYDKFEDILAINEFGRRLYPQFLDDSCDMFHKTYNTSNSFLALKIELIIDGIHYCQDFEVFNKVEIDDIRENNYVFPEIILKLLGEKNFTKNKQEKEGKIFLEPIVDDRMFVVCWYENNELMNELKSIKKERKGKKFENNKLYKYQISDKWYSYIFIDKDYNSPTCQHFKMKEELIKKHTYERFIEWGTLYGMSRYSFVCLTDESDFAKNTISKHVSTMYYQLVVLCLIQRASILKFSNEVTKISGKIQSNDYDPSKLIEEIEELNGAYLQFVNKIYFREVTAQEQGIEMYDKFQEIIRIERDIKDLNREIDELYQFAKLLEDRIQTKNLNKLSMLGAILLIPTLITSFLGMNILDLNDGKKFSSTYMILFLFLLSMISIFGYIALRFQRVKSIKIILWSIVIIITLLIMFIAIYFSHFVS